MFCRECGNKLNAGERFCGRCGAPNRMYQDNASAPSVSRETPKKSSSAPVIIVLIIILAIIMGIMGFFVITAHFVVTSIESNYESIENKEKNAIENGINYFQVKYGIKIPKEDIYVDIETYNPTAIPGMRYSNDARLHFNYEGNEIIIENVPNEYVIEDFVLDYYIKDNYQASKIYEARMDILDDITGSTNYFGFHDSIIGDPDRSYENDMYGMNEFYKDEENNFFNKTDNRMVVAYKDGTVLKNLEKLKERIEKNKLKEFILIIFVEDISDDDKYEFTIYEDARFETIIPDSKYNDKIKYVYAYRDGMVKEYTQKKNYE